MVKGGHHIMLYYLVYQSSFDTYSLEIYDEENHISTRINDLDEQLTAMFCDLLTKNNYIYMED